MTSVETPAVRGKRLAWVLGAIGLGTAGFVLVGLYQPARLYDQYLPPMRTFLAAALAKDSTALVATGASARAVKWGLQAGRADARALQELATGLGASWGGPARQPPGDSILVLFRGPRNGTCYDKPVLVAFAGPPSAARVLTVTADCLNP
jgi:hypothetical protein